MGTYNQTVVLNHVSAVLIFKVHRLQFTVGNSLSTLKDSCSRCHLLGVAPSPREDMIVLIDPSTIHVTKEDFFMKSGMV